MLKGECKWCIESKFLFFRCDLFKKIRLFLFLEFHSRRNLCSSHSTFVKFWFVRLFIVNLQSNQKIESVLVTNYLGRKVKLIALDLLSPYFKYIRLQMLC